MLQFKGLSIGGGLLIIIFINQENGEAGSKTIIQKLK